MSKIPTIYKRTFFISILIVVCLSLNPVFKSIADSGLEPLFATIFYGVGFGFVLRHWSNKAKKKETDSRKEVERWNSLSSEEKQLEKLEELKQSGLVPTLGRVTSGFMHGVICMSILVMVLAFTGLILKGVSG